jgi:hypothetical protein
MRDLLYHIITGDTAVQGPPLRMHRFYDYHSEKK